METKRFKCLICKEVFEGGEVPHVCPICGATRKQFVQIKEENKQYMNNTDEYFIIIGNGAAGFYAAESIRERNKTCKITMISNESELTYFRPAISDKINDEIDDKFYVVDKTWYEDNNINIILNTNVDKIDEEDKLVVLSSSYTLKYDKLIIATGSKCFIPNIDGINLNRVFTLRNTKDLKNIKSGMNTSNKAVVIGGGLLGLEAAWELKLSGLEVVVVNNSDTILNKQLDKDGSEILQNCIIDSGIEIKLSANISSIEGNESVERVVFEDGSFINCDMVIMSVGVRANIQITNGTSIKVDRGILVDKYMNTSISGIYACGDVAQFDDKNIAIWPVAVEMGKVAGANACGDVLSYNDDIYPVFLEAMHSRVFSIGNISDFDKEICSKDLKNNVYKKIFIKNNKLIGAILINDLTSTGKVIELISGKGNLIDFINNNIK